MRRLLFVLLAIILVSVGWFFWPFLASPEAQVEKQHQRLFSLASKRSWNSVSKIMDGTYQDQWDNNAAQAVTLAQEILASFFSLEITWQTQEITSNDGVVKLRGMARISGKGAGPSQMVMDHTNKVQEPWVFTWKKQGWKPSDWRLISVSNKELDGVIPQ